MVPHKKKTSDLASASAQSEDKEWKHQKLAGWFLNFKEFSQVARSGWAEAVVVHTNREAV